MQKEYTRTDMNILGDMLERIGIEETLKAVAAAAEWNTEIAKELA
jgi:hypothetical protein